MRTKDAKLALKLTQGLVSFALPLPGLNSPARQKALIAQMIDSVRRIEYLKQISIRSKSDILFTPYSGGFDAFKGSASLQNKGRLEEALWLTYLATHFGKHKIDGWNLVEDFYGSLGDDNNWTWERAKAESQALEPWIIQNLLPKNPGSRMRRFSNHRKYESLKAGPRGAGAALKSYVDWIMSYGSHADMIKSAQNQVGQNPKEVFAYVYNELDQVMRLGRLGKFDLLCNWSNLGTAPIYPDRPYIDDASGPHGGAQLLFGPQFSKKEIEKQCIELGEHLSVSPQVIEDALCNWQKSPAKYQYFRG